MNSISIWNILQLLLTPYQIQWSSTLTRHVKNASYLNFLKFLQFKINILRKSVWWVAFLNRLFRSPSILNDFRRAVSRLEYQLISWVWIPWGKRAGTRSLNISMFFHSFIYFYGLLDTGKLKDWLLAISYIYTYTNCIFFLVTSYVSWYYPSKRLRIFLICLDKHAANFCLHHFKFIF